MNGIPDAESCGSPGRIDVLSAAEERVLSELRDIVSGARAGARDAGPSTLMSALMLAGASVVSERDAEGLIGLAMRGVRFSLQFRADGAVVVRFPAPLA
jgi:hypothetical protein